MDGEDLLGLIVLWPETDHLYVYNIAVAPEAQGRGVATRLLPEQFGCLLCVGVVWAERVKEDLVGSAPTTASLSQVPRRLVCVADGGEFGVAGLRTRRVVLTG